MIIEQCYSHQQARDLKTYLQFTTQLTTDSDHISITLALFMLGKTYDCSSPINVHLELEKAMYRRNDLYATLPNDGCFELWCYYFLRVLELDREKITCFGKSWDRSHWMLLFSQKAILKENGLGHKYCRLQTLFLTESTDTDHSCKCIPHDWKERTIDIYEDKRKPWQLEKSQPLLGMFINIEL